MRAAIQDVVTGEITTATRSVEIDGVQVMEGNIIALLNGKLVLSTPYLQDACLGLLEAAQVNNYELITLFYGAELSLSDVEVIADQIRTLYPDQLLEIQEGCQPHYQFIIAIE
jgi:dihydroxyacetone kinase-like predicted kinase